MAGLSMVRGFRKGSGTVAGTARRVLLTTVPDPFLNHAQVTEDEWYFLGQSCRFEAEVRWDLDFA